MPHKNPFHDILLDFMSSKTNVGDSYITEVDPEICPEKPKPVPAHINNFVSYAVLRDRWIDLEIEYFDTYTEFQFDAYFPCGWCVPCENGISLLWDFRANDFQISPGAVGVKYECNCFPQENCDPAYGLLYNFESGNFDIAPGVIVRYEKCNCFPQENCDPAYGLLYNFESGNFEISPGNVNMCDVCMSPMMYDFRRCKFNMKNVYLPKTSVHWK